MKIYTKTGDTGETGLFGGDRVSKASRRVETYGEIDELNSAVGWVRVQVSDPDLDAVLNQVQNDLFEVGAELGSTEDRKKKSTMPFIAEAQVESLERAIDKYEEGPH
jgi:cob(I)alamin adenosyltransferase